MRVNGHRIHRRGTVCHRLALGWANVLDSAYVPSLTPRSCLPSRCSLAPSAATTTFCLVVYLRLCGGLSLFSMIAIVLVLS